MTGCLHCGGALPPRIGSGGQFKFCRTKCRNRYRYLRVNQRPERKCKGCEALLPAGAHANRDYCTRACKKAVDSVVAKARYPGNYKPRRYHKLCGMCGRDFTTARPMARFCSNPCLRRHYMTIPEFRAKLRARSDAIRAVRRGAERALNFKPVDVLERDGWVCQLCGIGTPRELRGTTAQNAPELDHVIPLSAGGEHSPENTRCLCLKCNRAKSDKVAA